jgi:hypothetical protein
MKMNTMTTIINNLALWSKISKIGAFNQVHEIIRVACPHRGGWGSIPFYTKKKMIVRINLFSAVRTA